MSISQDLSAAGLPGVALAVDQERAGCGPLERLGTGAYRIELRGRFTLEGAGLTWKQLQRRITPLRRGDRLEVDLSRVEAIDGGTMALLVHIRTGLATRGVQAELTRASQHVQELIRLYGAPAPSPLRRRGPESFLAQLGRTTLEVADSIKGMLGFLGATVRACFGVLKEPRAGNWRAVFPTMERTGFDAVPIVVLINFLVGFVLAYQASGQLAQFGANIYVADLVGKAMTREMAPLMTAIIVCGRSGAGFAAELGSMKVCEEIDALRTMGFGPIRYLVLPKVIALILVMPLLTLIADLVGIAGGCVVAMYSLDVSADAYLAQMQSSLVISDVVTGLVKSVAFAIAIAMIACQQGFATTGGAEGVGRRTTSSVVSILFALIVIDAVFTVIFNAFHL